MAYGPISSIDLLHSKQIITVLILVFFAVGAYVLLIHSSAKQKASVVQTDSSQTNQIPGTDSTPAQTAPLESSASNGSASDSQSGSINSSSNASASVTVNGQTYSVEGNGSMDKTVQSPNGTTNLNISVQNSNDASRSSSSSHSSVHVNSNSSTHVEVNN